MNVAGIECGSREGQDVGIVGHGFGATLAMQLQHKLKPASLALLAPALRSRGVEATRESLVGLMAAAAAATKISPMKA